MLPSKVKPTEHLSDGEVEDYVVTMSQPVDQSTLQTKEAVLLASYPLSGGSIIGSGDRFGESVAALGIADGDGGLDFAAGRPGLPVAGGSFVEETTDSANWIHSVSPSPVVNGTVTAWDQIGKGNESHTYSTLAEYNGTVYSGALYGSALAASGSTFVVGAPGAGWKQVQTDDYRTCIDRGSFGRRMMNTVTPTNGRGPQVDAEALIS